MVGIRVLHILNTSYGSWLSFHPSFNQHATDVYRNLGGLGLFCKGGHGVIFFGGGRGGVGTKKISRFQMIQMFRGWHLCLSYMYHHVTLHHILILKSEKRILTT